MNFNQLKGDSKPLFQTIDSKKFQHLNMIMDDGYYGKLNHDNYDYYLVQDNHKLHQPSSLKLPYKPPSETLYKHPSETLYKPPRETHYKPPRETLYKHPSETHYTPPRETYYKPPRDNYSNMTTSELGNLAYSTQRKRDKVKKKQGYIKYLEWNAGLY
jgi:hypothetical protein